MSCKCGIKIPRTLAEECRDYACPDLWGARVLSARTEGQCELVSVYEEDLPVFFMGLASAVDIARGNRRPEAKRWAKSLARRIAIEQARSSERDFSMALSMLGD